MTTLVCQGCGYSAEVEITGPDGEPMTGDEYIALQQEARMTLLCDECAKAREAGFITDTNPEGEPAMRDPELDQFVAKERRKISDVEALDEAIEMLDELWEFDAARGLRDSLAGMEYVHRSCVPQLRELRERLAVEQDIPARWAWPFVDGEQ